MPKPPLGILACAQPSSFPPPPPQVRTRLLGAVCFALARTDYPTWEKAHAQAPPRYPSLRPPAGASELRPLCPATDATQPWGQISQSLSDSVGGEEDMVGAYGAGGNGAGGYNYGAAAAAAAAWLSDGGGGTASTHPAAAAGNGHRASAGPAAGGAGSAWLPSAGSVIGTRGPAPPPGTPEAEAHARTVAQLCLALRCLGDMPVDSPLLPASLPRFMLSMFSECLLDPSSEVRATAAVAACANLAKMEADAQKQALGIHNNTVGGPADAPAARASRPAEPSAAVWLGTSSARGDVSAAAWLGAPSAGNARVAPASASSASAGSARVAPASASSASAGSARVAPVCRPTRAATDGSRALGALAARRTLPGEGLRSSPLSTERHAADEARPGGATGSGRARSRSFARAQPAASAEAPIIDWSYWHRREATAAEAKGGTGDAGEAGEARGGAGAAQPAAVLDSEMSSAARARTAGNEPVASKPPLLRSFSAGYVTAPPQPPSLRRQRSVGWHKLASALGSGGDATSGGGRDADASDGTVRCWPAAYDDIAGGPPLPSLRCMPLCGTMEDTIRGGGRLFYHGAREPGTDTPVIPTGGSEASMIPGGGSAASVIPVGGSDALVIPGGAAGRGTGLPPVAERERLLEALLVASMNEAGGGTRLAVMQVRMTVCAWGVVGAWAGAGRG
jgi:hypothetical protein